ncbi:MAG: crossover junction endodeoxyribonuclease RuvC [Synergistetes bacterium]|nr:crossover junction endodeoxyribonuclease RuvC [Synergistota bacterium]
MLCVGVDPGSDALGYAAVVSDGSEIRAVDFGSISVKGVSWERRLLLLYNGLRDVVGRVKPEVLGVEKLFFNRNVRTAIRVAEIRGVVLLIAAQQGIPVVELNPIEVKMALTGYGRAKKEQVREMVKRLLDVRERLSFDVSDALAVAVATLRRVESSFNV